MGVGFRSMGHRPRSNHRRDKKVWEKKIATLCLSAGAWAFGPVVTLVTNSSKVIGAAIRIHFLVSFGAECLEDRGNLLFYQLTLHFLDSLFLSVNLTALI